MITLRDNCSVLRVKNDDFNILRYSQVILFNFVLNDIPELSIVLYHINNNELFNLLFFIPINKFLLRHKYNTLYSTNL
jgi:hypothetical protein